MWETLLDVNDLLRGEYSRNDPDNVNNNPIYHFTVRLEGTSCLVIEGNLHHFLSLPADLNCVNKAVLNLLNDQEESEVYQAIQNSKNYRLPEEQFTEEDYEWPKATDDEDKATVYRY